MADCKLSPGTVDSRFMGRAGDVTLFVHGTTGTVLFQQATYKGNLIAGLPSDTLTCTLETGIGDLDIVFSFSDPRLALVSCRRCVNTPLALVSAREPFQRYRIRTPSRDETVRAVHPVDADDRGAVHARAATAPLLPVEATG
jgi:hypothetical protein